MRDMSQNVYRPWYSLYESYKTRLFSFSHYWALTDLREAVVNEMADVGFFYFGDSINDTAACFPYGGVIGDWEIYDDQWMQHTLHYPQCFYLNAVKGSDYINKSLKEYGKSL